MALLPIMCQSEIEWAAPCPEVATKVASTPWLTLRVCGRCYTEYRAMSVCCPEVDDVWADEVGHTVTVTSVQEMSDVDCRQLVVWKYDGMSSAIGGTLAVVFCKNYTRKFPYAD